MEECERTPQQRAALATYHLLLRAFAGLPGMTTHEVACLCGTCDEAARVHGCHHCNLGDVCAEKAQNEPHANHVESQV